MSTIPLDELECNELQYAGVDRDKQPCPGLYFPGKPEGNKIYIGYLRFHYNFRMGISEGISFSSFRERALTFVRS